MNTQGATTWECRSTDRAGNVAANTLFTVRIDAKGPRTTALAKASVKRGKAVRLRYRVSDLTPRAKVTIRIYRGARLKKTLTLGWRPTGKVQSCRWTCRLARGTYTWKVCATDQAGNRQSHAGASRLKVS